MGVLQAVWLFVRRSFAGRAALMAVTGSYQSSVASTAEELCAKPEIRPSPGAARRARHLGSSAEILTALTANPIWPLLLGRMEFSGWTGNDCHSLASIRLRFELRRDKAGEGIRTLDVQLGKLAFYH